MKCPQGFRLRPARSGVRGSLHRPFGRRLGCSQARCHRATPPIYRLDADGAPRARGHASSTPWPSGDGRLWSAPVREGQPSKSATAATKPPAGQAGQRTDPRPAGRARRHRDPRDRRSRPGVDSPRDTRPRGRLVSEVHDTKLVSRFALELAGRSAVWYFDLVPGSLRNAGRAPDENVVGLGGRPDQSRQLVNEHAARPFGIQYRAKLSTTDPRRTPELRSVSLSFRTANLASKSAGSTSPT